MKTSIAIAPMLLAASAYAGAALFIKECAGGQALIYFKGWAFNGGLLNPDDFDHTAPSDEACELEGSSSDATCYKRGYKFHLSETSPYGCNHANHVTEGYITTPDGEKVSVTKDGRCEKVKHCVSSGLGGCSYNGWQCEI